MLGGPEAGSLTSDRKDRHESHEHDGAGLPAPTIERIPVPNDVRETLLSSKQDTSRPGEDSDFVNDAPERYQNGYASVPSGNLWLPGIWSQFPYRGILSIVGCLGCVVASIAILVVSDGQPVSSWSTASPTVYLALLMTATNMLARYAFHDGVKISWWYKALNGGSVENLQTYWSHADGFWTALFAGRSFNIVTLASIAVTIIAIDQPLIQRSSTVNSIQKKSFVNVTAKIASELPYGFTGTQAGRLITPQLMTQPM
jgi:hypothetical protein